MANREKVFSYLGFAAKSRKLITGYNTCIMTMEKGKLKLLILTKDLSENTMKKMMQKCSKNRVNYRIFGNSDEISQIAGTSGKGIFGITDGHFAKIICEEIDRIQSEREVF